MLDIKILAFLALITYRYRKSAEIHKKLPPLKHMLALPTEGQKCTQTEVQSFEIGNFDLGHPVLFMIFPKRTFSRDDKNNFTVCKFQTSFH